MSDWRNAQTWGHATYDFLDCEYHGLIEEADELADLDIDKCREIRSVMAHIAEQYDIPYKHSDPEDDWHAAKAAEQEAAWELYLEREGERTEERARRFLDGLANT